MSTPNLAAIEARTTALANLEDKAEYGTIRPEDRKDLECLLALVREQQAKLDAVRGLADRWESRGEHDMAFSKTIPDEDIALEVLTDGAQKVENARHLRTAMGAGE